jgi:hypothetical protein
MALATSIASRHMAQLSCTKQPDLPTVSNLCEAGIESREAADEDGLCTRESLLAERGES